MRNQSPYPTIGRCIYCPPDKKHERLTREHIIPKALGGKRQLLAASCNECAEITKAIEGYISGAMLGTFRNAKGIYSRNSKKRNKEAPQKVRIDGKLQAVSLDIKNEHPAPLILPHLPAPGYLTGAKPDTPWGKIDVGFWIRDLSTSKLPPGDMRIVVEGDLDELKLGRAIAKIAHCETINVLGVDGFEPFLPDIILGKDNRVPYFVGCLPGRHEPLAQNVGWNLRLFRRDHELLVVHIIRFFGDIGLGRQPVGTPYFVSVVGRIDPATERLEQFGVQHNVFDTFAKEIPIIFRQGLPIVPETRV